ncbi:MAG: hypothetical protein GXP54_02145 [Deltaproteobacteria bacterium]|nr:hypothetical protein [Deltaproteobacteria bacterium]
MKHRGLLMRLFAPMGGLILLVAATGNERANCTQTPAVPEVECAAPADCEGLPHDLCLNGGWQCVDGKCDYKCEPVQQGCYSDTDCKEGTHCSVSDGDCQSPPGCQMCDVCYGECVPDENECVQSGCSGEVCAEQAVYTPCVWLDWFDCLKLTTCGHYGENGACGFEQNDDFLACLAKNTVCADDTDCPDGFICQNDSWCGDDGWCADGGKCVPAPEPSECKSDADCAPDEYCKMVEDCPPCVDADPACDAPCLMKGECAPKTEPSECQTDSDCEPGEYCKTETICPPCVDEDPPCKAPCQVVGECLPQPQPECQTDKDCLQYEFCDHSPWDEMVGCCVPLDEDGAGCPDGYPVCPGTCKMKPGLCWNDADCENGQHCEGASICPEGAACFAADHPGKCVADEPVECEADAECAPGQYCNVLCGNDWCKGTCDPVPDGQCVKDADCSKGQKCVTGPCPACYPCPCFGTCEDTGLEPGQCWTDADCEDEQYCDVVKCDPATGEKCIGPYECKPKPVEGCLSDKDCAEYEYCDFIVYDGTMDCCPPNAFCDANIPPCEGGVCRLQPGLCWTDDDCAFNEQCEGVLFANCGDPTDPDVNCIGGDWPGKCAPKESECMSASDCPTGFTCEVETICPPCADDDPPCLAPCWSQGTCVPQEKKCNDDSDCADGQYCDFNGSLGDCCMPGEFCLAIYPPCEGVCKDKGLPPGECWNDGDCKAGEHCEGAIICPPGAYCFVADTPGKCVPDQPQECKEIKPGSHGVCGLVLGVIFDGEKCVYESGCGCWPDCGFIFDSIEACENTCQPAPPPPDCMADEDCPSGEYCDLTNSDQTICVDCDPNAPDCDPGCFSVGQCLAMPEGTCVKDADCQPWQQCAFIYPCPLCLNCTCFGICQDLPD